MSAAVMQDEGPRPAAMVLVAVVLGGVLTAGWFLAVPPSQPTPASPPPSPQEQLEAVLAEQPGNVAARRQLGDLHFAADRFDAALEQYLLVLEARPDDAATLARAGWVAFEGGDSATAHRLVTAALDANPDDPEGLWYLAQIRLRGLDDPAGAVVALRTLLDDDLDADLRRQVRDLLRDARHLQRSARR